jgi:hypothetical protein
MDVLTEASRISITEQIRTRAGEDILRLANELVNKELEEVVEHEDDLMRRIGWILVSNGHQDLWQLVYLEFIRGSAYVLGDEARFLLHEPAAKPSPLHE